MDKQHISMDGGRECRLYLDAAAIMNYQTPIAELIDLFSTPDIPSCPDGWQNWPNVIEAHRLMFNRRWLSSDAEACYPENQFHHRGIVICAGGHRLFTNGYVCLRMLRDVGCTLPVEFWFLGPDEMDNTMRSILSPYDVVCRDAREVAKHHPARILCGYEVKCFAMLWSQFKEIILLDADNVPLVDPSFLFETPQYKDTGAIFWPDFGRLSKERTAWKAAGVEYRNEPEFESGQIVVDKERCWQELCLAKHLNDHSDFWYKHVHGDKETYHLAWRKTGKAYSMPSKGIHALDSTMCQHDFNGRRIFQHRNMDKWMLDGSNRKITGFERENECRRYLADLREIWSGTVGLTKNDGDKMKELAGTYFYHRVLHDWRTLDLKPDGTIGYGCAGLERRWSADSAGNISIVGDNGLTCILIPSDGIYRGRWMNFEKMAIEINLVQDEDGLYRAGTFWVRSDNMKPDMGIVGEVYHADTYWTRLLDSNQFNTVVDVGAHIGTFAKLWHNKNPKAKIICVEACPENISCLKKNVAHFAKVVQAACTHRAEPLALVNAVKPNCRSTGGSIVIRADESGNEGNADFWNDKRELSKINLESLMDMLGTDHIDLLKLDCEGSEFDILGTTPSLSKIKMIVGEYHGQERWNKFRIERFKGWDYGQMSSAPDGLGVFHLVNKDFK